MHLNDILVCHDSTPAGHERLQSAVRLARAHNANLTAVYPLLDDAVESVLFPSNRLVFAGGGDIAAGLAEPERAGTPSGANRAELSEQQFYELIRVQGIRGEWHLLEGLNTPELIELAKSIDLAMLGQFTRDGRSHATFRPDEVALGCGRPVLILPYAGSFPSIGARVLVAWDGTREAVHALHDSIPLMLAAETVTVITVLAKDNGFERAHGSLQRVVRHLERHGIPARYEESLLGALPVADVLLSRAADLDADLIVAGAYHHSPYREAIFGGVTRDLLDHMTVPVLMSH